MLRLEDGASLIFKGRVAISPSGQRLVEFRTSSKSGKSIIYIWKVTNGKKDKIAKFKLNNLNIKKVEWVDERTVEIRPQLKKMDENRNIRTIIEKNGSWILKDVT